MTSGSFLEADQSELSQKRQPPPPPSAVPLPRFTGEDFVAFAGLEASPALLLAVSGGPDSMALMLLASRWAASLGSTPPALHVATVDHGLRPESAAEATLVAAAAAKLGLPHATLAWTGEKPRTRIQERARAARYDLLAAHARALGAPKILTAHHADDQAETVLMRLTRGSGIGGLAGMRRETPLAPGMTLVRPLLDVPKADLVALCAEAGLAPVDDPSNRDPAYARARLRGQQAELDRIGLDRAALVRLARRAARADAALEAEVDRVGASITQRGDGGLDLAGRDLPLEILLRLLRRRIEAVVPDAGRLRLERLERLAEALAAALHGGRPFRATLGGARIVLGVDAGLAVTPAPARREPRR